MAKVGRPTLERQGSMLAIRLTDHDRELLEGLVKAKAKTLAEEGVEVSSSSVVRGLIRQAAVEAGLAKARK